LVTNNKEPEQGAKTGYEIFDHTADIGIYAYGTELSSVFKNAAKGMFAVIFHDTPPKLQLSAEERIKLQSGDLEQLLKDWLDEIHFIFTTEHKVFSEFDIVIDTSKITLDAIVSGGMVPEKELLGSREIKAVTYHLLSLKKTKNWQARVLFDI
jgi:SHS2 domain-containing protein